MGEKDLKKEEKKEEGIPEIVLKVFMHCGACAKKIEKSMKKIEGVEEVRADIVAHRVVVKANTIELDPMEICETVQKKTGRRTELISPLPKPPKEKEKKEEKKKEKKEEPTPITTVMLKVMMHCEACSQVLQRRIKKLPGVESVDIDLSKGQAIVKGFIDPDNLVEQVYRKTRKQASIVKEEKKKEEGGGGEEKKEVKAKAKGDDDDNKDDDMKKKKKKSDQWPVNYHTDYVYAPQVSCVGDSEPNEGSVFTEERIVVKNNHQEKLFGILQKTNSAGLVVLCHGFRCSKENIVTKSVSDALVALGISTFCFDFSGNGESEGTFQYGNYWKEVEDLRSVVLYFVEKQCPVRAIVGHSKGGDVVILYASKYHDIPTVVNISGRFDLMKGNEKLGKNFMEIINREGFIDVKNKKGVLAYRVTKESLQDRFSTDVSSACCKIDQNCRVLTVHGSSDEIIPVEDAFEFSRSIANHELRIIEGADHCYTCHHAELVSTMLDFFASINF